MNSVWHIERWGCWHAGPFDTRDLALLWLASEVPGRDEGYQPVESWQGVLREDQDGGGCMRWAGILLAGLAAVALAWALHL